VIYDDRVKQRKADLGVRGWIAEVGLWIRVGKRVWEGQGDESDGVATVRLVFGSRGPLPTSQANIALGDNVILPLWGLLCSCSHRSCKQVNEALLGGSYLMCGV
jgi:hypothetical protein